MLSDGRLVYDDPAMATMAGRLIQVTPPSATRAKSDCDEMACISPHLPFLLDKGLFSAPAKFKLAWFENRTIREKNSPLFSFSTMQKNCTIPKTASSKESAGRSRFVDDCIRPSVFPCAVCTYPFADALDDGLEAGPPEVVLVAGREVRAAHEWVEVGRQPHTHRPPAAATHSLQ